MQPDPIIDLLSLLRLTALRDQQAFSTLHRVTASCLKRQAMLILERSELAEEVLQEAYLAIWNSAWRYDPAMASPLTWMVTVVRRKAFDVLKHSRLQQRTWEAQSWEPETDSSQRHTPDDHLEQKQNAAAISLALGRLLGPRREIFSHVYFRDMSVQQAADTLNMPLGTAKTWVRRGLADMRQKWSAHC